MSHLVLVILGFLTLAGAQEAKENPEKAFNPETILLSDFSFTRPPGWEWISTKPRKEDIVTEVIFNVQNAAGHATVCLNHFQPHAPAADAKATAARWKTWFKQIDSSAFPKPTIIGKNKVTFVELRGTFQGQTDGGRKPKNFPNYGLYGVIIDNEHGNVLARLWGPASVVEENKKQFRDMVKQSLQGE